MLLDEREYLREVGNTITQRFMGDSEPDVPVLAIEYGGENIVGFRVDSHNLPLHIIFGWGGEVSTGGKLYMV